MGQRLHQYYIQINSTSDSTTDKLITQTQNCYIRYSIHAQSTVDKLFTLNISIYVVNDLMGHRTDTNHTKWDVNQLNTWTK